MRLLITSLALTPFFAVPGHAATCTPKFVDKTMTATIGGIIVGTDRTAQSTVRVGVRNKDSDGGPCTAKLQISRLSTTLPNEDLPLSIGSGGSRLQILSTDRATSTPISDLPISGIPAAPSEIRVPVTLGIGTGWGIKSGSYSEQLQLSLIGADGSPSDQMLLTVQFTIPPAAEVRVAGVTGEGAVPTINLGMLDPRHVNRSAPFGIRVFSTAGYGVAFTSENSGYLHYVDGADRIRYQLLMDGNQVSLSGAVAGVSSKHTNSYGKLYRLVAVVDPFEAHAGDYSDRVTVTVSTF